MTNGNHLPAYPLFRTRGRSTLHGLVLVGLCVALAISSVRGRGPGEAAAGSGTQPPAATGRA
jgi:hypothetical protein